MVAMPVLPRWRHEVSEPVEELRWGEVDDAVGIRPGGLPPALRADPVGSLVSGEHVADATDAAIFTADHGEPLQREERTGAIPQEVFQILKRAWHVAVDERYPDTGIHRKPTGLSSEHVGGRIGVKEPLPAEPPHDPVSHAFGEGCEVRGRDRPRREKLRAAAIGSLREHAISHARMEQFLAVKTRLEDEVEETRRALIDDFDQTAFASVATVSAKLLTLRRRVLPVRRALEQLTFRKTVLVSEATLPFLATMTQSLERFLSDIAADREIIETALNLSLTVMSHRTNQTMNRLAPRLRLFLGAFGLHHGGGLRGSPPVATALGKDGPAKGTSSATIPAVSGSWAVRVRGYACR